MSEGWDGCFTQRPVLLLVLFFFRSFVFSLQPDMLREDNSAFSEEEVGGAWAQPRPEDASPHDTSAFLTATAGPAAAASSVTKPNDGTADVRQGAAPAAAHPQQQEARHEGTLTLESSSHLVYSDRQSCDKVRDDIAFGPAVVDERAGGGSNLRTDTDITAEEEGVPPFLVSAAWAHSYHNTCPAEEEGVVNGLAYADDEQKRVAGVAAQRVLQHTCKDAAAAASTAAAREAGLDEDLMDNDDSVVVPARRNSSSLQNSRGVGGGQSRGPPIAAVMDAHVWAPTTSLVEAHNEDEGSPHHDHAHPLYGDQDEALLMRRLARPASQDSITFSIQSSSASSSSTVSSSGENGAAAAAGRGEEHTRQAEYDGSHPSPASASLPDQADGNSVWGSSGPLPGVAGVDDAQEGVRSGLQLASESLHSSPAAVTLWGVHRDLRRKRIKKVSHYILGSLLGEGAYGVVRDCIDINTDNVNRRFQRCAIKIVNSTYARADMPAIFGNRGNSNYSSGGDAGSSSPSPDDATLTSASAARGTLKRMTGSPGGGMRYHREEEQRHQESFQREMRNLQRFHCKNIIRALDSFTRYNKEYVVLPIAICSVQQLVRQLMRTRWREAVREWRKRQRKIMRKNRRRQRQQHHELNGGKGNGDSPRTFEETAMQPLPHGVPLVPSAIDTLDLDDLSFMVEDESGLSEDDSEKEREEDEEGEEEDDTTTTATVTSGAHNTIHNSRGLSAGVHDDGASRSLHSEADVDDGRHSSGSLSDHEDEPFGSRGSANTNNNSSYRGSANGSASRRRGLPRVSSTGSNTTTTTTTARTIDSYDNGHNNNSSSDTRGNGSVGRGHQRGNGGEDETSDLSSCGANSHCRISSSNGNCNSHNASCVLVMSATPTMQDRAHLLGKPNRHRSGEDSTQTKMTSSQASAAKTATNANSWSKLPSTDVSKLVATVAPVDDSRPHLSYPICSTTLLKGIFYQVMTGVNYLHQQNLAHNDIKPSNVLLFEDGTVKLGDLGSVSDVYNDQGTPLFASPELCKYFYGAATPPTSFSQSTEEVGRDAAKSSDMWCCGLLLYYLITGKPGPLPVQLRYFQSLHSRHTTQPSQQPHRATVSGGRESESTTASATAAAEVDKQHETPEPPPPPQVVTRYQLYRAIASQTDPVDLSGLPDMIPPDLGDDAVAAAWEEGSGLGEGDAAAGTPSPSPYPPNSVRHLLAGLLELDPRRRLTAAQALRHPWLRITFRVKGSENINKSGSNANQRSLRNGAPTPPQQQQQQRGEETVAVPARKAPSRQAMEDAIQRDVARRVTESRHVQRMLLLDRQRHLQFVADCCNTLNLNIPPEIVRVHPAEPYREEGVDASAPANPRVSIGAAATASPRAAAASARASTVPSSSQAAATTAAMIAAAMVGGGRNSPRAAQLQGHSNDAVTGTVLRSALLPAVMPPGCVDTELFLPHTEEDYYEQKSGKSEFDVRVLRRKPLLMAQLDEYFHNVVLVQCGYRIGPDPNYQAMRVRAVPIEDEMGTGSSSRRRGGGSGGSNGRGNTQQPSVVILPGASGSVYRRSSSAGAALLSAVEGAAPTDARNNSSGNPAYAGAAVAGDPDALVEDVWGAGPRHQPRVHVDENGQVVTAATASSASHHPTMLASATATAAAGRVVGSTGTGASNPQLAGSASQAALSGSASRTSQRNATSFPIQSSPPSPVSGGKGGRSSTTNNSGNARSSFSARPAVSASNSSSNLNNGTSNRVNRHGSVETVDSQEVMGTAVLNSARASGMLDNGNGNSNSNGRRGAGHSSTRGPRDASESASEAEQNVAMHESSKCLCGLM